ncbi:MAG: hypothetical protein K0S92_185 [Desertimonas sp.]|nr:hypothetical protein [Desertimonas sp.]
MKLLPSPSYARRTMRADDSLGRAMEAAFTLLAFFGIGFALDRWLGTTPVMMIVFSMLAAVGMFLSWKARYTAQMEALEAERAATRDAARSRPAWSGNAIKDGAA